MASNVERLFTPGPTPLPPSVEEILGRPALHHRTSEFQTVLARTTAGLMRLFGTRHPVLTLTASGSGGMEALVANVVRPGETVAVLAAGKFGERWNTIARAYGLHVIEMTRPWGSTFSPKEVAQFLDEEAVSASVLFLTHSETSTGVLHDIEGIAAVARERNKLVVADLITSLGVHPIEFDRWGLTGAVSGSQKGLMLPPGLAFVVLSGVGWERAQTAGLPRYYFNLAQARSSLNKNSTPFTPAVPVVLALEETLRMIEREGADAVFARHARHAAACRAAVRALGLELFADRPSHGVTAARPPEGKDAQELVSGLLKRGFRIAGGQEPMKGKLFRIGHMGHYADQDILDLVAALDEVVVELGWAPAPAGAAAAAKVLSGGIEEAASPGVVTA